MSVCGRGVVTTRSSSSGSDPENLDRASASELVFCFVWSRKKDTERVWPSTRSKRSLIFGFAESQRMKRMNKYMPSKMISMYYER